MAFRWIPLEELSQFDVSKGSDDNRLYTMSKAARSEKVWEDNGIGKIKIHTREI